MSRLIHEVPTNGQVRLSFEPIGENGRLVPTLDCYGCDELMYADADASSWSCRRCGYVLHKSEALNLLVEARRAVSGFETFVRGDSVDSKPIRRSFWVSLMSFLRLQRPEP